MAQTDESESAKSCRLLKIVQNSKIFDFFKNKSVGYIDYQIILLNHFKHKYSVLGYFEYDYVIVTEGLKISISKDA